MAMSYDTPRYWFDTIYALILIEHKEQTFDSVDCDNIKKDLLSLAFPLKKFLQSFWHAATFEVHTT